MSSAVYLISGPMAAGKTTVAGALARRFERGVHLQGDVFRRSIVNGRAEVTPDLLPEAMAQLRLRYELAAQAANRYAQAGFTVAYEDVIAGECLSEVLAMIHSRPCHVIVLVPAIEELARRAQGRARSGYDDWTVERLYEAFSSDTPRIGHWLDTTKLDVEQTVDEILALTR
jgi:predicted kinase